MLPFFSKVTQNGVIQNVLAQDAWYVTDMAKLLETGLSSLLLIHLDKTVRKPDLFKAAREALSLKKSVIVKNFVNTGSFNFTLEDLEEHLMISPHMLVVEAHDISPLPALSVS